jgi:hypothetical protein
MATDSPNKTITIIGKHNIDTLHKLENPRSASKAKRLTMDAINEVDITHKDQLTMLNKLYMDCEFPLKSLLERELERKIQGYKAQDIKKEIYEPTLLITLADTIEKLLPTKLQCFYCKTAIVLLYKNVREPTQWTLDRIDNEKCHSKENTVVACLKCNLQRRVMHIDKFTFTKSLKISKVVNANNT